MRKLVKIAMVQENFFHMIALEGYSFGGCVPSLKI